MDCKPPKINILSYNRDSAFSHYVVNIFRDADRRHISSFCSANLREIGEFVRKEGKNFPITSDLDMDFEKKTYPAARLMGLDKMDAGNGISFSKLDHNEITSLLIYDLEENMCHHLQGIVDFYAKT